VPEISAALRRTSAVASHELRLLRRDVAPFVILIVMPLIVTAFTLPAFKYALDASGYPGANGSEQATPGMLVLFSWFLVDVVGFTFFREHGWNTWTRLQASPARTSEVIAGKILPPLLLGCAQWLILFSLGSLLFDLHIRGSLFALVCVACSLSICVVALGVLLMTLCRTVMQLNALTNIGAFILAGLAGALTPFATLPSWVRAIAPYTPGYWAMRGFRSIILDGQGLGGAVFPCAVLCAFAAVFAVLASLRYRSSERKLSWA
jgi:ABC-2 type transport system permease protein